MKKANPLMAIIKKILDSSYMQGYSFVKIGHILKTIKVTGERSWHFAD
jgi:hypothetical protein